MQLNVELATVAGAIVADRVLGEWPNAVHPVVWMGKTIALLERCVPASGPRVQLIAGALITALVPTAFAGASAVLLVAFRPYPVVEFVTGVILLKSTFALRALAEAATEVERALQQGAIERARRGLSSLCSRDASALEPSELVAATIESVAENASDSFVAPLFYYALFGIPGALFYRAVNTLDAMIGYHGRYEYLGKVAARLDDAMNFVPARLTACFLLCAGWLRGRRARGGWSIWRRDGHTTESPNAGRPMAVMAGLLGVQLEKAGQYRLGDPLEPLSVEKIREACGVLQIAALMGASMIFLWIGARHVYP
ncbi:MAG TPA: cobalamin biosynthesis protein [Polyangiaceae bacterium]|nr:cobalamin biosynthesis protein [Polyangiaceae bacterium]